MDIKHIYVEYPSDYSDKKDTGFALKWDREGEHTWDYDDPLISTMSKSSSDFAMNAVQGVNGNTDFNKSSSH